MRTLAELKRKIVLGTKLHTFNHWYNKDMGIREIGHVQSNSFAFKTDHNTLSWCEFPKAKELIFEDTNKFTILVDNEPCLTYTFI